MPGKDYSRNIGNTSSHTFKCVTPAQLDAPLDSRCYFGHLALQHNLGKSQLSMYVTLAQ